MTTWRDVESFASTLINDMILEIPQAPMPLVEMARLSIRRFVSAQLAQVVLADAHEETTEIADDFGNFWSYDPAMAEFLIRAPNQTLRTSGWPPHFVPATRFGPGVMSE